MKRRLKFIVPAIAVLLSSAFATLIMSRNVSAATVEDQKYKYVARALYKCYTEGYVKKKVNPAIKSQLKDFVNNSDEVVGLPPDFLDKDEYTCADFMTAISPGVGVSVDDILQNATETIPILEKLGYAPSNSNDMKCEQFSFETTDSSNMRVKDVFTPTICATVADDDDTILQLSVTPSEYTTIPNNPQSKESLAFIVKDGVVTLALNGNPRNEVKANYKSGNTTWSSLSSDLIKSLNKYSYDNRNNIDPTQTIFSSSSNNIYYFQGHNSISPPAGAVSYVISNGDNPSYRIAYKNLTGRDFPDINISPQQRMALYQDYLVSYYGAETTGCADKKENVPTDAVVAGDKNDPTAWQISKLYKDDGSAEYCYVRATKNASSKIFGVEAGTDKNWASMPPDTNRIGFLDIIKAMSNSGVDKLGSGLVSSIGQPVSGGTEDADAPGTTCFDGGGALGWVLCPLLEGASWAVNQIYNGFIEPALTINTDLLSVSDVAGEQDAYDVWQIFQTLANIAFAIMILVVIISQLTGVGIDNYGIKRILPRLIVAALLINLSFIICQLAVDISNILGVSLKNLFNGLGPSATISGNTGSGWTASFVTIIVSVVAVGGAFLALGLGVIIPILVAAISALIAVFFLFVVLAGRQAAVVILVVISPLALVMYMLPNTKKYFDKFVKIFITLLVVYPICGLVMGGGDFASRVLLAAGGASADSFSADGSGFFYQISAVLISIVPFFFIPSLVKSSLAGLGNIGSKISGIGSKIGGQASKTSRNALDRSGLGLGTKARQAERAAYRDIRFKRRRAGYDRNGDLTRRGERMRRRAQGQGVLGALSTRGMRERRQLRLDEAEGAMLANERKLSNAGLHIRNQDEHVSSARAGMEAAEMDQQVKEQLALLRQRGEDGTVIADSPDRLGAEHADMLDRLNANPNDETAQARLRAVQSLLAGSDPGREHLSNNLDRAARSGQNTAVTIAASHLMEDHGGAIKAGNRDEEKWLQSAAGGNVQSRDNFSLQGLSGYTAQSLADADDRAHDALINNFKSMTPEQQETVRRLAWEMNNNPGINAKESVKQKFADLAKGYTPEPNRQEAELQNQTQILNDINDQLHHDPNGQQGTQQTPPQPSDSGPSTEDWEDYINGTGNFA